MLRIACTFLVTPSQKHITADLEKNTPKEEPKLSMGWTTFPMKQGKAFQPF